jgi:hypothetical protein
MLASAGLVSVSTNGLLVLRSFGCNLEAFFMGRFEDEEVLSLISEDRERSQDRAAGIQMQMMRMEVKSTVSRAN